MSIPSLVDVGTRFFEPSETKAGRVTSVPPVASETWIASRKSTDLPQELFDDLAREMRNASHEIKRKMRANAIRAAQVRADLPQEFFDGLELEMRRIIQEIKHEMRANAIRAGRLKADGSPLFHG